MDKLKNMMLAAVMGSGFVLVLVAGTVLLPLILGAGFAYIAYHFLQGMAKETH